MTQLRPHVFVPDLDLPPDTRLRRVCAACHLLGTPGDPHHNVPDVAEPDVQQRRTGERGDA
jgi:hypothetical protein